MKPFHFLLAGFLLAGWFVSVPVAAQEASVDSVNRREDAVRIFIDCNHCDMNYIRREIPYVNYVRDVKEAQVYILETEQRTGSGGEEFTFTGDEQEYYYGDKGCSDYDK